MAIRDLTSFSLVAEEVDVPILNFGVVVVAVVAAAVVVAEVAAAS